MTSDKYESRRFDVQGEEAIDVEILEAIPFDYAGSDTEVVYETDEFTAVCPWTGLPDFGTMTISYEPDTSLVELKSLKYYLSSFRNVGILQEHAVNRVLKDLVALLQPISMTIEAEYNQVAQEAFSGTSSFEDHELDAVLVAVDYRGLPLSHPIGDLAAAERNVADCVTYLRAIAQNLQARTGAAVILQNIAPPAESFSHRSTANWIRSPRPILPSWMWRTLPPVSASSTGMMPRSGIWRSCPSRKTTFLSIPIMSAASFPPGAARAAAA